ncbi:MAG: LytTR family transcriptional regulator DNA-binding domain-containing protein [Prevotellaceae bacterium]|jgi:hypothetical protein|nr:LytTR family transcriptional regulator DNA-binding domain-containing protein [Prevotellaceae bacterium]
MAFFIKNKRNLIGYSVVWITYAVLHALSIYSTYLLPLGLSFIDAFVHAILFAEIGVILYNVIQYGNYEKMPQPQKTVNYGALALLSVSLWIILGYAIDYLIADDKIIAQFTRILPFYILTGFMIYLILILYFRNNILQSKSADAVENINNEPIQQQDETQMPQNENLEILERIAVKSGQKIHVVLVSDILYLQADGDYVYIFTIAGKYLKEQTMKYFENNLPTHFARVHRSYIVNIEAISRIERYEKQNQLLTLKNGHQIKISTTGYKLLKQKLNL